MSLVMYSDVKLLSSPWRTHHLTTHTTLVYFWTTSSFFLILLAWHHKDVPSFYLSGGHSGACSVLCYLETGLRRLVSGRCHPTLWTDQAWRRITCFQRPKFSHTTPLLRYLHCLPVDTYIRFAIHLMVLITTCSTVHSLWASSMVWLDPPSLETQGRQRPGLFSFLAPRCWIELPVVVFKLSLKTYIYSKHLNGN